MRYFKEILIFVGKVMSGVPRLVLSVLLACVFAGALGYYALHRSHGEACVSAECVWPTKCLITSGAMSPLELSMATSANSLSLLTMATVPTASLLSVRVGRSYILIAGLDGVECYRVTEQGVLVIGGLYTDARCAKYRPKDK
jgi:hypothetical protein